MRTILIQMTLIASTALATPNEITLNRNMAFCRTLLDSPSFNLGSLNASGLLQPITDDIHVFRGANSLEEHETKSIEKFVQTQNPANRFKFLTIGNIPGITGVPSVDLIVFDEGGAPLANVSVKTQVVDTFHDPTAFLKRSVSEANRSVRDHYALEPMADLFGFTVQDDRLLAKDGLSIPDYRQTMLMSLLRILGIESNGNRRPVQVLIDLSGGSKKRPLFRKSAGRVLMTVTDEFAPEMIDGEREKIFNVTERIEKIRMYRLIDSYYFLFKNCYVKIDANGYRQFFF